MSEVSNNYNPNPSNTPGDVQSKIIPKPLASPSNTPSVAASNLASASNSPAVNSYSQKQVFPAEKTQVTTQTPVTAPTAQASQASYSNVSRLQTTPSEPIKPQVPQSNSQPQNPVAPKSSWHLSKWVFIIPGIVLVLLLSLVVFIILNQSESNNPVLDNPGNRSFSLDYPSDDNSGSDSSFEVQNSSCSLEKVSLDIKVTSDSLEGLLFFIYDNENEYIFSEDRSMVMGELKSFELSLVDKPINLVNTSVVVYAVGLDGVSDFSRSFECGGSTP